MHWRSRLCSAVAVLCAACMPGLASSASDPMLVKGERIFGEPLNAEHGVFRLNDTYVIWLLVDKTGDLFEVVVGPKSKYTTEFPNAEKPSVPESLSEAEYQQTLKKISELRDLGKLRQRHGDPVPSEFGPLNTDRFERAFVERIVSTGNDEGVNTFTVYFSQEMSGSPEQIILTQSQSMVCLVGLWYYLQPEDAGRLQLGKWQTLQVAGPNLQGRAGCDRTTAVRDADGFNIEQPQTETIVVPEPYRVRALTGRVLLGESPIEAANVEFLRIGTRKVLRTRTDSSGNFRMSRVPDGTYKFKVTKDGFKALSGTIIVNKHAANDEVLSFELPVGT